MQLKYRLLVFGLPQGTTCAQVQTMGGSSLTGTPEVFDLPGDPTHTMAMVSIDADSGAARRVAERFERQRHQGGHLQTWLCVMPWA